MKTDMEQGYHLTQKYLKDESEVYSCTTCSYALSTHGNKRFLKSYHILYVH